MRLGSYIRYMLQTLFVASVLWTREERFTPQLLCSTSQGSKQGQSIVRATSMLCKALTLYPPCFPPVPALMGAFLTHVYAANMKMYSLRT